MFKRPYRVSLYREHGPGHLFATNEEATVFGHELSIDRVLADTLHNSIWRDVYIE